MAEGSLPGLSAPALARATALLPAVLFPVTYVIAADRYAYLPAAGIVLALAANTALAQDLRAHSRGIGFTVGDDNATDPGYPQ